MDEKIKSFLLGSIKNSWYTLIKDACTKLQKVRNKLKAIALIIVPYVTTDFNRPLSVEEFNEMAQAMGMGGGSLSTDGLTAIFYLADLDPKIEKIT